MPIVILAENLSTQFVQNSLELVSLHSQNMLQIPHEYFEFANNTLTEEEYK